ncbi:DNA-binding transcriptional LysR family regulator [Robbsia andropogonis]|uniref:LysR family transcriptional regulator n=1 Tax=Robbsia andropogonis TaxID=28092 RepID=UPI003D24AF59
MDIRSVRYFIETVRLKSFTQAAERLNVTQSTVSKMVRLLEQEVGEPLLIREGRNLALTDTGVVVFARGEQMLATLDLLKRDVEDTKLLRRGTLRIGIPPMVNVLFTGVLKRFRERHKDIELVLSEGTGQEIEREVAAGHLDIGLSVLPTDPMLDLRSQGVARYPVWVVAAEGTFPKHHTTLPVKVLHRMPMVSLSDEFALTRRIRQAFSEVMVRDDKTPTVRKMPVSPTIVARSKQWDWVAAMASAGIGVALLPEPFLNRLSDLPSQSVLLTEPAVFWEVAHVWSGDYLSRAAIAWLEISKEMLGVW